MDDSPALSNNHNSTINNNSAYSGGGGIYSFSSNNLVDYEQPN